MWGKDRLFHSSFQIIHHLFPLGARFIGRIARGQLTSFGQIACKWLFCLCGIAWKNITERGRGGAYVPARVALQGRIHRDPAHNACVFGMETPLRGRSGGHIGTAPTYFVWVDCMWTVDAVLGIAHRWLVSFEWIAHRWLVSFEWIAWKNITEFGRGGACVPARIAL